MSELTWWERIVRWWKSLIAAVEEEPVVPGPVVPPPVVDDDGDYAGSPCVGDMRDKGSEIYREIGRMQLRLLANDDSATHHPSSRYYFLSGDVVTAGNGLQVQQTVGGDIIMTAGNFTSDRTGLRYRFLGWRLLRAANPLLEGNEIRIASKDARETTRAYWVTVCPPNVQVGEWQPSRRAGR